MRRNREWLCRLALLAVVFAAPVTGAAQSIPETPAWQPGQPVAHLQDYAGAAACASCHPAQSKSQAASEMGRSMTLPATLPAEARLPIGYLELGFVRGPYTYTLGSENGKVKFSVADAKRKITEPVFFAVGSGTDFQSYLIRHDGEYYRLPVDYFGAQEKLGLNLEADPADPATLEAALGTQIAADGLKGCFGCHSPASVVEGRIDIASFKPGIGCEVCHGPGAKHVAAMRAGKQHENAIFSPARLQPEQQVRFCDNCHESAEKMTAENPHGVRSVVSPDYRFEKSRCWNSGDQRASCFFCHDPHAPMARQTAAYDSKCLACHAAPGAQARADQSGKSCPVGQHDCAGCHMPKVNVPKSPIVFTDHRIRIAAAGAPFPE